MAPKSNHRYRFRSDGGKASRLDCLLFCHLGWALHPLHADLLQALNTEFQLFDQVYESIDVSFGRAHVLTLMRDLVQVGLAEYKIMAAPHLRRGPSGHRLTPKGAALLANALRKPSPH